MHDAFDYASLIGHAAFEELSLAGKIARKNTPDLSALSLGELNNLFNSVGQCRKGQIVPLVKAVSLFQTNMESLISAYELKKHGKVKDTKFVNRWECAFKDEGINFDFTLYANFYENFRITLIHFKNDTKKDTIETVRGLEFIDVYNGIKCGWEAFDTLSPHIWSENDENSWEKMCECHGLPISITENEYPRLKKLSQDVWIEWEKKGDAATPTF